LHLSFRSNPLTVYSCPKDGLVHRVKRKKKGCVIYEEKVCICGCQSENAGYVCNPSQKRLCRSCRTLRCPEAAFHNLNRTYSPPLKIYIFCLPSHEHADHSSPAGPEASIVPKSVKLPLAIVPAKTQSSKPAGISILLSDIT